MKKAVMITDLQYGSTGKGLFAAYLAAQNNPDTITTAWGPNAGHTVVTEDGEKLVTIALPSGMFTAGGNLRRILLGPGSIINPEILVSEMNRYAGYLNHVDVIIHPNAAVVTERHREAESKYGFGIGSTMKGVGEAVIQKIRRDRANMNTAEQALRHNPDLSYCVATVRQYNELMDVASTLHIEGAQGWSLGINSGFYPYTTSRECSKWQLLSDCAVPGALHCPLETYGVARTFPIRVANRTNDKGEQIGWSGPCYPDQDELEWAAIGVEPELTTVTKLPRRLFSFSMKQIEEAIRGNGVHGVFLNFCNYLTIQEANELIYKIDRIGPVRVCWTGWGPKISDVLVRP